MRDYLTEAREVQQELASHITHPQELIDRDCERIAATIKRCVEEARQKWKERWRAEYPALAIRAEERAAHAKLREAAENLYDNRLGWSDGRNPYAHPEFWDALRAALKEGE